MGKGFAISFSFVSIFGCILLWGLAVVPIAVLSEGEEIVIAILVPAMLVLFTVGLLPFINFVSKRAFYFPGTGPPVTYGELKKNLLQGND